MHVKKLKLIHSYVNRVDYIHPKLWDLITFDVVSAYREASKKLISMLGRATGVCILVKS